MITTRRSIGIGLASATGVAVLVVGVVTIGDRDGRDGEQRVDAGADAVTSGGECQGPTSGPAGLVWLDAESGALVRSSPAGSADQVATVGDVVAALSVDSLTAWNGVTGDVLWCRDVSPLLEPVLSDHGSVELLGTDGAFHLATTPIQTRTTAPASPTTDTTRPEATVGTIAHNFDASTGAATATPDTQPPGPDSTLTLHHWPVHDLTRHEVVLTVDGGDGDLWSATVPGTFADRVGNAAVVVDQSQGSGMAGHVDGRRSRLTAYDLASGEMMWTTNVTIPVSGRFEVVDDTILVTMDSTVAAYDRHGSELWVVDHGNPAGVSDEAPSPGQIVDLAGIPGDPEIIVGLVVAQPPDELSD